MPQSVPEVPFHSFGPFRSPRPSSTQQEPLSTIKDEPVDEPPSLLHQRGTVSPNQGDPSQNVPMQFDQHHYDVGEVTRGSPADITIGTILIPPRASPSINAMLQCFERDIIRFLSVEEGHWANPWRTMIIPLSNQSEALHHAILSLGAVQLSKSFGPRAKLEGVEHRAISINRVMTESDIPSLATTLVLAMVECWDQETKVATEYLAMARSIVERVARTVNERSLQGHEVERVHFLCKAWLYLDIIAGLTCRDFPDSLPQIDEVSSMLDATGSVDNVDHLMGLARGLFLMLARITKLTRGVRECEVNTEAMVTEAEAIKKMLTAWQLPADPHAAGTTSTSPSPSELTDLQRLAKAYQLAATMHLDQAVPERATTCTIQAGEEIRKLLVNVPVNAQCSRLQIYPLLLASCELQGSDRKWAGERWDRLDEHVQVGISRTAKAVMLEVWRRRDSSVPAKLLEPAAGPGPQAPSSSSSATSKIAVKKGKKTVAIPKGEKLEEAANGTLIYRAPDGRVIKVKPAPAKKRALAVEGAASSAPSAKKVRLSDPLASGSRPREGGSAVPVDDERDMADEGYVSNPASSSKVYTETEEQRSPRPVMSSTGLSEVGDNGNAGLTPQAEQRLRRQEQARHGLAAGSSVMQHMQRRDAALRAGNANGPGLSRIGQSLTPATPLPHPSSAPSHQFTGRENVGSALAPGLHLNLNLDLDRGMDLSGMSDDQLASMLDIGSGAGPSSGTGAGAGVAASTVRKQRSPATLSTASVVSKAISPAPGSVVVDAGLGRGGTPLIPRERTVRGKQHWLGVMEDWGWEVMLG